jgi:hypothetical protein
LIKTADHTRTIISEFCKKAIVFVFLAIAPFIAYSQTLYSYQSGQWGQASTWTVDPSGTLYQNPGNLIPTGTSAVVILTGRNVTASGNNRQSASVEIRDGAILDLGTNTGHNFGTVSGHGTMRISSSNFPGGTFTAFVSSDGGTVEYYDFNGNLSAQLTYNNLKLTNSTGGSVTFTLNAPTNTTVYTINGNLSLASSGTGSLTLMLGSTPVNNNKLNITTYGNISVANNCSIRVNNFSNSQPFDDVHNLTIYGDLINNGSIRFTGLPSPVVNNYYTLANTSYSGQNYGAVKVTFSGSSNNSLVCNGVSDFYRLIVDKGIDQTYMLDVTSSGTNNFSLYGPNNQGGNVFDCGLNCFGTGYYQKALYIAHGTLRLNSNITIPSLTEGGQDFNIIPTAALWVNGATIYTTKNYQTTGYTAATLYGRLRISSGMFSTRGSAGIVLGQSGSPEVIIDGTGTLDVSQIWAANGNNLISYTQNGGTCNVRANGEDHGGPMFGFSNKNTVFTMTGGSLNFLNYQPGGQGIDLESSVGNYSVTGGTVNVNFNGGTVFEVFSTVPFYNLNVTNSNATGAITLRLRNTNFAGTATNNNFSLLNDLTLNANTTLDAGTNNVNFSIGRNFTMNVASTYTPGTNTTTFNGNGGQVFTNAGAISTGLYNFVLANSSNTVISNNLNVRNNLTINSGCNLADQGLTISVGGNIYNSGTHTSQAAGSITLIGNGNPTIIGGNGLGAFGNLNINKSTGYTYFASNQALNGDLRLANNALLDINSYNLTLSATSRVYDALTGTSTTGFNAAKMVRTSGVQSDGGFTKSYNNTSAFLFPLGTGTDYTPASIQFTVAPDNYGSVNIKPVSHFQPFASSANCLNYYWKVTGQGFTGIKPASIKHIYTYVNADWAGRGNIVNYVPAVYHPYTWTVINDVAQVADASNTILFSNVNYLDGDYTAGQTDAFGAVVTYYSRTSGNWSDGNTWSMDTVLKWDGAPAGTFPGASNPVIIGDGATHNHVVTVSSDGARAGTLQIKASSVLDLGTSVNHDFGALPVPTFGGNGTLRISSATPTASFPAGDFGSFLGSNGGTVEYYTTGGVDFTLPSLGTYWNLNINPAVGRNITFPDANINILDSLSVIGMGQASLNTVSARTIDVEGSISVNSGILRFLNVQPQSVIVKNNINVLTSGRFDVSNTGTAAANALTIYGNLTNNGVFDMNPDNTRYCDVTFTAATNNVVDGTGATTDFNRLTVDKGNSRNSVLDVKSSAFSLSNNTLATSLFLPNGTFRLTSPLSVTLSTNGAFSVPATGCLSANGGTINVGTSATNSGDLLLAGRLEVIAGNVNIGVASNVNNNDIEYSSAGNPEIDVMGGNLFVNGQIRRNINNTLGSLIYNQSGGNVIINGQNQNPARAKFEITNSQSRFTMSGGNLTIVRAGGTTYGDLYLTPGTSNVTGGTIQLGNTNTLAGQIFIVNSSSPLWNFTVDGTTNLKTASLQVNNLALLGSLSINGNSVFLANGLQVNIGGNFTNQNPSNTTGTSAGGYQPGNSTQWTIFDGVLNNQTISGISGNLTNFANVEVNNTFLPGRISLAANSNLLVNNDLKLTSGILNDGGNTITVNGDVNNAAIHESPAGNGIVLAGSSRQNISGSGSGQFGNIIINNASDVYMVDNAVIHNNLNFVSGNLYIDDYLLTLGQDATVTGVTSGLPSRMIVTNGALSDAGVKKMYPASASSFTFAFGVAGKYTPVTINLTSNTTAGSITAKPVNSAHPSLQNAPGDELKYYWTVVSSGFGAVTATQTYNYLSSDVTGIETNYYTGRYVGGDWVPAGGIPGTVNATAHSITLAGVNYIDGEYTAGETGNFASMPTFYSRNATLGGDWDNVNSWSTTGHAGAAATSVPNGNKVIIASGHTITVSANSKKSYSIELYGSLNLGTTINHSFGYVSGNGTIRCTSTSANYFVFPGGNYDAFMNTVGSTVEFTNNNTSAATLPAEIGHVYKPFQNVIFSGTGIKAMTFKNMKVLGDLTITAGSLSDALANKNIYLLGSWSDNVASGFVPGTGMVSFEGTSAQSLNAAATEGFYDLRVNNSTGLTLNRAVNVSDQLYLVAGNINTSSANLLSLLNTSPYAVTGGSSGSFINGPMAKVISNGSFFNFTVGKSSRYGNILISNTATGTQTWVSEYFNSNPLTAGMDPASKLSPLDLVSNNEYWQVNGAASTLALVRIRWDAISGIIPADASTRQLKIRVAEWNGTAWQNRGGVVSDGGLTSGTVETSSNVNLAGNHYFTLGIESLPTATITGGTANLCNNGSNANIPVSLTGVAPWTIHYRINGANETTITNIGSTPFNIVANSGVLAALGGGPNYTFTISYVSDASGSVGIRDFTTSATITLLAAPAPSITGKASVSQNESGVSYNVVNYTGHTYNWVVTGGTISGGQSTNQITVTWGAGATGNVSVTETLTATGCSTVVSQNIIINTAPTPLVTGNNSVCDQSDEIYTTAPAVGHTFNWTVAGGGITGGQGTNQITVHWNSPGLSRTVSVRETITATGAFADNTLSVDVQNLPSNSLVVSDPITCTGTAATIVVQGGEAGTDYALRLNSDNSIVTTVHNATAGDVSISVNPASNTVYNIYATNEYGCSIQLTDLSTVTVKSVPVIGPVSSINNLTLR